MTNMQNKAQPHGNKLLGVKYFNLPSTDCLAYTTKGFKLH